MSKTTTDQWTITEFEQDTHLLTWLEAFLIDRKAQGLSKGTIHFYKVKLKLFAEFCDAQVISRIPQITPNLLRAYLLHLEKSGHNQGGRHACYRAVKTFLYWWEDEVEPEGWKNPIRKVKAPKLVNKPIDAIPMDDIRALLDTCDRNFTGVRDKAIILTLLDTGARAQELLDMSVSDVNSVRGEVNIRQGKGGKYRTVFLGKTSRKALRKYLHRRNTNIESLWITVNSEPLSYWGLRQIMRRRAKISGVPSPGIHDFRRAFALECLRNGMDVYSLQKLMGHADLQVLRRYLAQTKEDIADAHRRGSPVDNSGLKN